MNFDGDLFDCGLCDNQEHNSNLFLIETNTGSYRSYFACNECAALLRQISSDYLHVFTTAEIDSLPKK